MKKCFVHPVIYMIYEIKSLNIEFGLKGSCSFDCAVNSQINAELYYCDAIDYHCGKCKVKLMGMLLLLEKTERK